MHTKDAQEVGAAQEVQSPAPLDPAPDVSEPHVQTRLAHEVVAGHDVQPQPGPASPAGYGNTQGRRGKRMPRINMAFSPENYAWIKRQSGPYHTMTEIVNTIIGKQGGKVMATKNRFPAMTSPLYLLESAADQPEDFQDMGEVLEVGLAAANYFPEQYELRLGDIKRLLALPNACPDCGRRYVTGSLYILREPCHFQRQVEMESRSGRRRIRTGLSHKSAGYGLRGGSGASDRGAG